MCDSNFAAIVVKSKLPLLQKAPHYSNYQTVVILCKQTLISTNTTVPAVVCSNITVKWKNLLRQLKN